MERINCNICNTLKSTKCFYLRKDSGKYRKTCISCFREKNREYYKTNKERERLRKKKWRRNNKEYYLEKSRENGKKYYKKNKSKILKKNKKWRENNKERQKLLNHRNYLKNKDNKKENSKRWYKENPEYSRYKQAKRRAQKIKATPEWTNLSKIKEIYINCPEGYHVDHIIPLNNPKVCGLHVPWNLQYLTAEDNLKKGNMCPI